MDNAGYTTLTRQSGLARELASIANNIANVSTAGYRRDRVIFSEHVAALEGGPSLSMAAAHGRSLDDRPGPLDPTGGTFDFAIEGPGFFLLETPGGQRLTRAGAFTPNAEGLLAAPDGALLLDAGGTPVFVPPDAGNLSLALDGTLSAGGQPLAQIGLVLPADPATLSRTAGTRFAAGDLQPVEEPRLLQGFLEGSNVNPVAEIARMIEVSRAYEAGQSFLEREDDRIRTLLQSFGR